MSINEKQLLFIKSSDNYIEVFYSVEAQIKSILLRNTLKSVENDLNHLENIFRCYSFLFNNKFAAYSTKFNDIIKNKLSVQ